MLSTLFEEEIYLGFATQSTLKQSTFENTFVGGNPIFLRQPSRQQLLCENCLNQDLTFICQVFCPLEAENSYNRVLYLFYCQKCQRQFKCIKQQSSKKLELPKEHIKVRTVKEESLQIESQTLDIKELIRIRNKAKRQIEQETILEEQQEQFEEEGQDIQIKEIEINFGKLGVGREVLGEEIKQQKLENLKSMTQTMQQAKKESKDLVFEEYRKVMEELDGPVLLYSNIPIPYNNQPINPRHFCQHCKGKLILQLQITEKLLLLSPKLVPLDWGSLLVFTCSNSCLQSTQECVVVQYEADAVQDQELKALKKRNKNKKRKEKSSQKTKSLLEKQKTKIEKSPENNNDNDQGDWD